MPPPPLSRRALLSAASLGLAGAGLAGAGLWSGPGRAAPSRRDLRFIFVRIFGGWDTTRVFATSVDNPHVDFEDAAQPASIGDLRFMDHPARPGVRQFFETHADRCLIINGLRVPSVNHRICERLALTGSNRETAADWPTVIAHARADAFGLPHVIAGGRSMPGLLGGSVVQIGDNGQVGKLLDGSILGESDLPVYPPESALKALLDRHSQQANAERLARSTDRRRQALLADYARSMERAGTMKDRVNDVHWLTDGSFDSQIRVATELLGLGLSRCITLSFERLTWDSHEDNDNKQHVNFVDLFDGLLALMDALQGSAGVTTPTLAEETVVVVISEMGRTPQENLAKGKDHWAHTSALLVGPGLDAGRVIGGYDDLFYGHSLDLASADRDDGGRDLTPAIFGATLLELADVGPVPSLPEYSPILGALA